MNPIAEEELALQFHLLEKEFEKIRIERGDPTQNLNILTTLLDTHASLLNQTTNLKLGEALVKLSKETDRLNFINNKQIMDVVHQRALHSHSLLAAAQEQSNAKKAERALQEIETHLKKDYYLPFDQTQSEKQLEEFYSWVTSRLRLAAPLKLHLIQKYGSLKHPEALASLANEFADHNFVWFLGSPSFHDLMGGELKFPKDLNIADQAASLRGWLLSLSENVIEEIPSLDLRERNLYLLPPEISLFKHLKELHLENNHLKHFPQALRQLNDLKTVWITGNEFSSLTPLSYQLPEHVEVINQAKAA